jgi:hypothetical protein
MQKTGELRKKAIELQRNSEPEQNDNPIDQMQLFKQSFKQRVRILSID